MKNKTEESTAVLILKVIGGLVLSVLVLPLALLENAVLTWLDK